MYKILIVDDNDNNRLTLNLLLEEVEEIEIQEAEDGQVAVEMCVKNHFDLIPVLFFCLADFQLI